MRLVTLLLMFALSLVAWECAADTPELISEQKTEMPKVSGSVIPPLEHQQASQPQQHSDPGQPDAKPPTTEAERKQSSTDSQEQQHQSDASNSHSTQDTNVLVDENQQPKTQPTLNASGGDKENSTHSQNLALTATEGSPSKETKNTKDGPPVQSDGGTQNNKVVKPSGPNNAPIMQTAAGTESGGENSQGTETKPNPNNTQKEDKDKLTERTGESSPEVKKHEAQTSHNTPTEEKTFVEGIISTPNTSGKQTAESSPTINKDQTVDQTSDALRTALDTKDKETPAQPISSTTTSRGKGNLKDTNLQTDRVVTPRSQEAKQKNAKVTSTRGNKDQTQKPASNTGKGNATTTTINTAAFAKTGSNPFFTQKTDTTTPVADETTTSNNRTTGDKVVTTAQTSVNSTAAQEHENFTKEPTSLTKMSKTLESLDTQDGSIGVSSFFPFAALTTLVIIATALLS